ncbi:hypothetical protein [Falsiroseomonas sp. HW251]|uniref:hypothetical protein n=1 Tax=Falsiroseomonas sp. HW251 TaxID=3390998 RepID=UPI003D31B2D1
MRTRHKARAAGSRRVSPPLPSGQRVPAPAGRQDDAFDLWLRASLKRAYDDVAAEPVPPHLLRLIEPDRG